MIYEPMVELDTREVAMLAPSLVGGLILILSLTCGYPLPLGSPFCASWSLSALGLALDPSTRMFQKIYNAHSNVAANR